MSEHTNIRKSIRDQIFSTKPETREVPFNGTKIELRQPSLDDVMNLQDASKDDKKGAAITTIIQYSYVPGTEERVFEETDRDIIAQLPFNKDVKGLFDTVNELLGLDGEKLDQLKKDATKSTAE